MEQSRARTSGKEEPTEPKVVAGGDSASGGDDSDEWTDIEVEDGEESTGLGDMPVNLELDNTKKHESANPPINNAVLLSDLTSMDSSTKEASAQLNEAVILEETGRKSMDQSDFFGPPQAEITQEDDPINMAVVTIATSGSTEA